MHIRRALLENLQQQLKTLPGFAGVWIKRTGPKRTSYPSITLHAIDEDVKTNVETFGPDIPRDQDRKFLVAINGWVRGTIEEEKAEADMDEIAEAIEAVLVHPLDNFDMILTGTDFAVAEDEPEIHKVTLYYQLTYLTIERDATV